MRVRGFLLLVSLIMLIVPLAGCDSSTAIVVQPPVTAQLCPAATQEWLRVDPLTSPTDQLSQVVTIHMGNAEAVTVTTESGVFASTDPPTQVEVALLPDTVHHLDLAARVHRIVHSDGCEYGGYTMRTRTDRDGKPLVIQQGQPPPPSRPEATITPENASRLEALFAFTPDARLTTDFVFSGDEELISLGIDSPMSRWSLETGKEIGPIGEGLEESVARCLAIDGRQAWMATCSVGRDRVVHLWDLDSGEIKQLDHQDETVVSVAFNPGGTLLAGGGNSNHLQVWEVSSGRVINGFEGDVPEFLQTFDSLNWTDDETLIAAASSAIFWWNVTTGQLLERLAPPEQVDFFVQTAFDRNGERLASMAQDENVYVWERGAPGWAIWPASPGSRMRYAAFSPDGRLLAAINDKGEMLLWEAGTGAQLASYSVSTSDIVAVRFSPDGRYIAVGGWESPIWLWGVP